MLVPNWVLARIYEHQPSGNRPQRVGLRFLAITSLIFLTVKDEMLPGFFPIGDLVEVQNPFALHPVHVGILYSFLFNEKYHSHGHLC